MSVSSVILVTYWQRCLLALRERKKSNCVFLCFEYYKQISRLFIYIYLYFYYAIFIMYLLCCIIIVIHFMIKIILLIWYCWVLHVNVHWFPKQKFRKLLYGKLQTQVHFLWWIYFILKFNNSFLYLQNLVWISNIHL